MANTKEHNSISIGNSGEYFVAAELERRGYTAEVPMSNTKDFDILAINRTTYKQVAIQVKTTQYKQKKWMLNKKCEKLFAPHIKYILVSLNELDNPEYHIVPSEYLAEAVYNPTRIFKDENDHFLSRWDLLDQ